jgi:sugar lactone lactonase YvrE
MSPNPPVVIEPLPVAADLLGESPFWHPDERSLWWLDIPGRRLNRWHPEAQAHRHWDLVTEPGCMAPLPGGCLMLAMRDGLWRFDPADGGRQLLAPPPYDPRCERFNDGKADSQGRFWAGTIYEPREPALASLHCWDGDRLQRRADGVTTANGLAFSPDGNTLYWSDTRAHTVFAFDLDPRDGSLSRRRVFARFEPREPGQPLASYGGRPDGAAVDVEGAYWVAMFEGRRLLRLSPAGTALAEVRLPVQCPTMPCFGDDDLRTLYVTTARDGRPAEELARDLWAGRVLRLRVDVPGLPVNFARL